MQTQSEFSEYLSHQRCWLLGVMHMIFSFFSFEEIFQKSALFSCLSSTAKLPPTGGLPIATVWGEKSTRQYKSISKWLGRSQYPGCIEWHWHKDHLFCSPTLGWCIAGVLSGSFAQLPTSVCDLSLGLWKAW